MRVDTGAMGKLLVVFLDDGTRLMGFPVQGNLETERHTLERMLEAVYEEGMLEGEGCANCFCLSCTGMPT